MTSLASDESLKLPLFYPHRFCWPRIDIGKYIDSVILRTSTITNCYLHIFSTFKKRTVCSDYPLFVFCLKEFFKGINWIFFSLKLIHFLTILWIAKNIEDLKFVSFQWILKIFMEQLIDFYILIWIFFKIMRKL